MPAWHRASCCARRMRKRSTTCRSRISRGTRSILPELTGTTNCCLEGDRLISPEPPAVSMRADHSRRGPSPELQLILFCGVLWSIIGLRWPHCKSVASSFV
jgi:hypothetical protein